MAYKAKLPDGRDWPLDLSDTALKNVRERRGRAHLRQLLEHVEDTLSKPDFVYDGIRKNEGWKGPLWGDSEGMCWCKRVGFYIGDDDKAVAFKDSMSFVIFVNGKNRIFGWEYIHCQDSGEPLGASYRFGPKL